MANWGCRPAGPASAPAVRGGRRGGGNGAAASTPPPPEVLQRALLELLEQRPENPLVFLARHFEDATCECSAEERAERLVLRCPQGHWAFKQNVADAYEALRDGGGGAVTQGGYQKLLERLAAGVPAAPGTRLLGFLRLSKTDEVPFETFKDAVTALCVAREVCRGPAGGRDPLQALGGEARRQVVVQFLGRALGVKAPPLEPEGSRTASPASRALVGGSLGRSGSGDEPPEPGARVGFGLFGPLGQFGDPRAPDWGVPDMISGVMDAVLQKHP